MRTPLAMLRSWAEVFGYQALGFLILVATVMLSAIAVPPAVWGEYWTLYALMQMVGGIVLSWVAQSVPLFARAEIRQRGDIRTTLTSALAIQGVLILAFSATGIAILTATGQQAAVSPIVLFLLVLAITLSAAQETLSYALQADNRFTGLGLGSALGKLGPLLAVAAIWAGAPAVAELLLAGLVFGFAASLVATTAAMPPAAGEAARPSRKSMFTIITYGHKLPIAIAAGLVSAWMHVWFVRAWGGVHEAGVYGWAASLHALVGSVLMPLSAVITPHLMDLALTNEQERSRHRADLFIAVMVLAAALAPAYLGAVRALSALLPSQYADAGPILVLLLATVPAQLFAYLATPMLRAHPGMIGRIVAVNVLMLGLGALLNLLLTPRLGGLGAALALATSLWSGALAIDRQTRRAIGEAPETSRRSTLTVIGSGATVLILASVLVQLPAVLGIAGGLIAAAALIASVRALGLLRPLVSFSYHMSFLPQRINRPLTTFFHWCDTGARSSGRGGMA